MKIQTFSDSKTITAKRWWAQLISQQKSQLRELEEEGSEAWGVYSREKWDHEYDSPKHQKISDKYYEEQKGLERREAEIKAELSRLSKQLSNERRLKAPRYYILDPRAKNDTVLEEVGRISAVDFNAWKKTQLSEAVQIAPGWAWFRDELHFTAEPDLTARDIMALLLEKENKRRLKLEKAHAVMAMVENIDGAPGKKGRAPIPQDVRIVVWQRDGGRCVECGSQESLEFDHVIPVSMGGANTARNLQLLCMSCNRGKGATLG